MSRLPRRACDQCARRKVKCDGQRPCQNCIQRQTDCVFSLSSRRNPVAKLSQGTGGPSFSVISEFRYKSSTAKPTVTQKPGQGQNAQKTTTATSAKPPAPPLLTTFPVTQLPPSAPAPPRTSVLARILNTVQNEYIQFDGGSLYTQYYKLYVQLGCFDAQTNQLREDERTVTAHDELVQDEPLTASLTPQHFQEIYRQLRAPPVIMDLIQVYYQRYCPELWQPHADACTTAVIAQNPAIPRLLINSILAAGANYARPPHIAVDPPFEISSMYFDLAKSQMLETIDSPSLYSLAAYQTLEMVAKTLLMMEVANTCNGLAIRTSISLGLHRLDSPVAQTGDSPLPETVRSHILCLQYCRYLFWTTMYLHFRQCINFYTLPVLSLQECVVQLPCAATTTPAWVFTDKPASDPLLSAEDLLNQDLAQLDVGNVPLQSVLQSVLPAANELDVLPCFVPNTVGYLFTHPHHYRLIGLMEQVAKLGARKALDEQISWAELEPLQKRLEKWYATLQQVSPLPDLDTLPSESRMTPARSQTLTALLSMYCMYFPVLNAVFRESPKTTNTSSFDEATGNRCSQALWDLATTFYRDVFPYLQRLPAAYQTDQQADTILTMVHNLSMEYIQRNPKTTQSCVDGIRQYLLWFHHHGQHSLQYRLLGLMLRTRFPLSKELLTNSSKFKREG
ncbi:hypothetical protein H4R35_005203 [Dimargaris xerosporica]|nr:hypothetical protein H4R35_005203 [Dimargaris xerosporica]